MDRIRNNKALITGSCVLLAFFGACSVSRILGPGKLNIAYTNSIFSVFIFTLCLLVMKKVLPRFLETGTGNKVLCFIFSLFFSMALHLGTSLENMGYVDFTEFFLCLSILALTLFWTPVLYGMLDWVDRLIKEIKITENRKEISFREWCMTTLLIFVMWLPVFLAFFPGAFTYDAGDEYIQVVTRVFSTHHPLIHVLLLGGAVRLTEHFFSNANLGIAMYTLFQMIITAGVFGYLLQFLKKYGICRKIRIFLLFFLGLFPVYPMYAVCSAKDTLFTTFFLMMLILFAEVLLENKKEGTSVKKMAAFAVFSILMMSFRNNGMYAYAAWLLVIVLAGIFDRKNRKRNFRLSAWMLGSLAGYFLFSMVLAGALHAAGNEHQEILTVPIQQLARTYTYAPETFTEEEKQTLYEILPEDFLKTYTPRLSDIVKSGFNNEAYSQNQGKYLKLWAAVGIRKPFIYLNAWLLTSYGYWYPDAVIDVYGGHQMYTFQYQDSSYFGFETEPPGVRRSLFPALESFYEKLSLEIFQQRVPVISMLFSPGFLFWVFLFLAVLSCYQKNWKLILIYIAVFWLWGTVLLGPTYLVRYVLILWFAMPFLGALPFIVKRQEMCYTTDDYKKEKEI